MASWMETHRTHPIFMSLSWHYQFWLVYCPYLPEHIVTACSYYRLFGMENHGYYWHVVTFLGFSQHSLLVVQLLRWFWNVFFSERSEFGFFAFPSQVLSLHLRQRFLLALSLYLQLVPLYFYQGLLLHCEVVFFIQLIKFPFVLVLQSMQPLNILIQFFLLLLHSLMMHFMEIPLLQQLVVSRLGSLRHNDCPWELAPELLYLIFQNFVLQLCVGHVLSTLDVLVPLFLH